MSRRKRPSLKNFLSTGVVKFISEEEENEELNELKKIAGERIEEIPQDLENIEVQDPQITEEITEEITEDSENENAPEIISENDEKTESDELIDEILSFLSGEDKNMWEMMLKSADNISRLDFNIEEILEDFRTSDPDRFTFYLIRDDGETPDTLRTEEQMDEPFKCVLKWDENGSAEVYI